jgi:predicted Rossmann-fold nucleotide-binding protein
MRKLMSACAVACLLSACQSLRQPADAVACTSSAAVPQASYVGPYAGIENIIAPKDAARDIYCADEFKASKYPRGFVTIFGSSRIKKDNGACHASGGCDETLLENDKVHAAVKEFARAWTAKHAKVFPVMTGAGPGLMEAGNEGAKAAGGPSIGYTTYYDGHSDPANSTRERPYAGAPSEAFNSHVTDGLIFTSVAQRESAMIRHSAAMVIAPGGTGTEWEIFQIIEMVKSKQLAPVPVYFFGDRAKHWRSLEARLNDMIARRVVRADELAFIRFAATPDELLVRLGQDLALEPLITSFRTQILDK